MNIRLFVIAVCISLLNLAYGQEPAKHKTIGVSVGVFNANQMLYIDSTPFTFNIDSTAIQNLPSRCALSFMYKGNRYTVDSAEMIIGKYATQPFGFKSGILLKSWLNADQLLKNLGPGDYVGFRWIYITIAGAATRMPDYGAKIKL